jgi:hypothetical protein
MAQLGMGLWNRVLIDAAKTWLYDRDRAWGGERFSSDRRERAGGPRTGAESMERVRIRRLGLRAAPRQPKSAARQVLITT